MDAGSIAIPTEGAWWITRTPAYMNHTSMSKTGYEATQTSMAIQFEGHIPSNSSTEWGEQPILEIDNRFHCCAMAFSGPTSFTFAPHKMEIAHCLVSAGNTTMQRVSP
mmetsp:Transcript_4004/g.14163  ORF Transcript_4004/g.14163 Transcript_4004/m.14163 type:complete len:108 (+) Transcript_4004:108-431(+)